jgi:hypothetical protein
MRKLFCAGLALIAFLACPKKDDTPPPPKDVVDVLPADNEISGWTKSSALQIAENATQLFDLIDGEGQIYVDDGFVKSAFQKYTGDIAGSPVELELRVFDLADTANADQVYHDLATGTETPWDTTTGQAPGREARIDESGLFSYRLDFWDDKFYVWLTINDKTTAGLDIAKLFCLNVSRAIRDTVTTAF